MRIVGGRWRGHPLRAPKGRGTRPTSDRVREALFDVLGARLGGDLTGLRVLDLYAGTGALGLEALSRGAEAAVFIENARAALQSLESNVSGLHAEGLCTVMPGSVRGPALARAARQGPFALLLADPPYRIDQAQVISAVAVLEESAALDQGAMIVWEHASAVVPQAPGGFGVVRTYSYGETAFTLLARNRGSLEEP